MTLTEQLTAIVKTRRGYVHTWYDVYFDIGGVILERNTWDPPAYRFIYNYDYTCELPMSRPYWSRKGTRMPSGRYAINFPVPLSGRGAHALHTVIDCAEGPAMQILRAHADKNNVFTVHWDPELISQDEVLAAVTYMVGTMWSGQFQ